MNLLISIDGACRRNGKPDCTASGGVFVQRFDDGNRVLCEAISTYEYCSTNQRGELLALLKALDYVYSAETDAMIVTDSEYLFNAMTKNWYVTWQHNAWLTSSGGEVKNRDIWAEIAHAMNKCNARNIDIVFYHIKGHCIPFGRVTADKALTMDPSGALLHSLVSVKYDEVIPTKDAMVSIAQDLSFKNNGFKLDDHNLKQFVVANVVADAIATKVVDAADQQS